MDVLEHDPMALLKALINPTLGEFLHSLTQGHLEEGLPVLHLSLLCDLLYLLYGIGSGRKDEE